MPIICLFHTVFFPLNIQINLEKPEIRRIDVDKRYRNQIQ